MRELIVDSFAGGGGASTGIEMALGRSPDFAINHDAEALALHAANHPETEHLSRNIWKVNPLDVVRGRPVGLAWFSPDCKHFSKAKGGRPVKRNIRDLAWVVISWAKQVRPRVIILENVEEWQDWGPLVEISPEKWMPCPDRRGQTFKRWCSEMRRQGYRLECRELRACDYGAPTIRKRLFVIARCDGRPIVWPKPTHGAPSDPKVVAGKLLPWRTAAEVIDWSLPCHSIFLSREEGRAVGVKRPLVDATLARIAKGVKRYVLEAAEPFIVPVTHQGDLRTYGIREPVRTITTANRGEQALVAPLVVRTDMHQSNAGCVYDPGEPMRTITTSGGHAVLAAFLAQHNLGMVGHDAREPVSTLTQRGSHQMVVSAGLMNMKGSARGSSSHDDPLKTICAGAVHAAEVRAFLVKYYGEGGQFQGLDEPSHTLTTKPRLGLVTVHGEPYEIADIGMRMLTPRELFRAQGFPDSYRIEIEFAGSPLTKSAQIRMCGNSVCPPLAEALVRANYCPTEARRFVPIELPPGDLFAAA